MSGSLAYTAPFFATTDCAVVHAVGLHARAFGEHIKARYLSHHGAGGGGPGGPSGVTTGAATPDAAAEVGGNSRVPGTTGPGTRCTDGEALGSATATVAAEGRVGGAGAGGCDETRAGADGAAWLRAVAISASCSDCLRDVHSQGTVAMAAAPRAAASGARQRGAS